MEIDEIDGNDGHIYIVLKNDEIQEILTAERDKRNELSIKYNRGVNIIAMLAASSLSISVVSCQKQYQMTKFQIKNIHKFYWSLKRLHV